MRSLLFGWIASMLDRVMFVALILFTSSRHSELIFMMLSTQNLNLALFSFSQHLCVTINVHFSRTAYSFDKIYDTTALHKEQRATFKVEMLLLYNMNMILVMCCCAIPFCILAIFKSLLNVFEGFSALNSHKLPT